MRLPIPLHLVQVTEDFPEIILRSIKFLGHLESFAGNPFVFKITVAVLPVVGLPDYRDIASQIEKKKIVLDEKEIEQALKWLQHSRRKEDGAIPELTDELAKTFGRFESIEDLRKSVREGLQMEKEMQEQQRLRQEILEKIAEKAIIQIPAVLIEKEKEHLLEQLKQGVQETLGMEFDEYLRKENKTEEELRISIKEDATKKVKGFLVLHELAKKENITATEQEVTKETDRALRQYLPTENTKKKQAQIDPDQLKQSVQGTIINEKIFQLLENLAANKL